MKLFDENRQIALPLMFIGVNDKQVLFKNTCNKGRKRYPIYLFLHTLSFFLKVYFVDLFEHFQSFW